jgi:hypothetical protein
MLQVRISSAFLVILRQLQEEQDYAMFSKNACDPMELVFMPMAKLKLCSVYSYAEVHSNQMII